MSDTYSSGPGYVVYDLLASGAESTQLSADETRIYISTDTGDILVYEIATRTLLQTINVAAELGAMTISDDGTMAYVVGRASPGGDTRIYAVNLTTGASSVLPNTATLGATDVEYIDGNRLLISADQTWVYNLGTQQASSPTGSNPVGFFYSSVMVESDGLVLIAQTVTSDGPLELYDETTGQVIAAGSNFSSGTSGFNQGVQAVTREAGLVAQFVYPEHVIIYDLGLNIVENLAYFGFYGGGLAFDSDGGFLLAYRPGTSGGIITAFNTSDWSAQLNIDVRAANSFYADGGSGDSITITSDDQFIILTDVETGFVQIIHLTDPIGTNTDIIGSNNDDMLTAVLGQNVDGRDGVDTLSISFREATSGVLADFRPLEFQSSIQIEGATINNIEIIGQIDGSDFDDVLGLYQLYSNSDGVVNGYSGNDQIFIGTAAGINGPRVYGGDGNDLIDARGTVQGGDYYGDDGDDTIYTAEGGRAFASGGNGNDYIETWGGADGGAGNDTIVLHEAGDITPGGGSGYGGDGADTISVGPDIFGRGAGFQLIGGAGADRLTGGEGDDYLFSFDTDGNANGAEDTGSERDTLNGGGGNDWLFAGYGDNVNGGAGDDVLVYSLAAATSGVTLNTSNLTGAGGVVIGGGTIRNIEYVDRLYATNFDDTITVGNNGALPSSATQVRGRAGNDTFTELGTLSFFYGEEGDDRYIVQDSSYNSDFYGGDGIDTVDYTGLTRGVTVMLSTQPFGISGTGDIGSTYAATLYEVENVQGTNSADVITGSSADNALYGRNGNDILDGGLGNDILHGGGGIDEARFMHGYNGVVVSLAITGVQDTGLGLDRLISIENLTGSRYDDRLTGDSGANVIRGAGGNDYLDGGGGLDQLIGGFGDDTYFVTSLGVQVIENAGQGSDTVITTFSAAVSDFTHIENLSLAIGAGDLSATGDDGNNILTGNDGANILTGGLGDDTIDGGANVDTAVINGNSAGYTITQLETGVFEVSGPAGTDTLTNVEYVQFNNRTIRLLPGEGVSVNFDTADTSVYQAAMQNIRDFDGNDLGGNGSWLRIGSADVDGDGDVDQILVNDAIGRFATVGGTSDGLYYFDDYGWAGETRIVGTYVDPLVASGDVVAGSDQDSQQRFQNDLLIENINRVLGADDYDGDGLQEVYLALTDGTAYLHMYMHADGNIRYANYQSQQEVIDFLTANGYDSSTWADWFPTTQEEPRVDKAEEPAALIQPELGEGAAFDLWGETLDMPSPLDFPQVHPIESFA